MFGNIACYSILTHVIFTFMIRGNQLHAFCQSISFRKEGNAELIIVYTAMVGSYFNIINKDVFYKYHMISNWANYKGYTIYNNHI